MPTAPTASSPAGFLAFAPTSPSYRVLWRALMVSPSGLPQWLSLRAPSEATALEELRRIRPEWTVDRIERERNP